MLKNWILATRPWSFPVSSMSVLVTTFYLFSRGIEVHWGLAIAATFAIILFHSAGNLLSDYFDFKKGIDAEDTFGSKTLTDHLLTPKQVLIFGIVMLILGCLAGLGLMLLTGPWLLLFGGLGALFTLLYPWMKAHALGDLDIILEYGILPALGTAFTVTGGCFDAALFTEALWIVPAFVTITVAVLHCNNARDTKTDARAGIKTFAMLLGKENSIALYIVEIALPIVWVVASVCYGQMPWLALLVLCTILPASAAARQAVMLESDENAMNNLDEKTAQLQLLNCCLLCVAFAVSTILSL